jgi:hypothetical protein
MSYKCTRENINILSIPSTLQSSRNRVQNRLNKDYNKNKLQLKDFAFRTFELKNTMPSNVDTETKYTTPPQALKFT